VEGRKSDARTSKDPLLDLDQRSTDPGEEAARRAGRHTHACYSFASTASLFSRFNLISVNAKPNHCVG